MKGVQARHREVQAKEKLRLALVRALHPEMQTGNQVMLELLSIFDSLDPQEHEPQNHCPTQEDYQEFPIALLRVVHGGRHREAATNQDQGIDESQSHIQLIACRGKYVRIRQ